MVSEDDGRQTARFWRFAVDLFRLAPCVLAALHRIRELQRGVRVVGCIADDGDKRPVVVASARRHIGIWGTS